METETLIEARYPHRREIPDIDISKLTKQLDDDSERVVVFASDLKVALDVEDEERAIRFADHEVPATTDGIIAVSSAFDIPHKFLLRQPPDMQEYLVNTIGDRTPEAFQVWYNDGGITNIRGKDEKYIDPRAIIDIAGRVLSKRATVMDFWATPAEFRLDALVPDGYDRGIGGDRKVGDLTRAGIRIGMDVKRNLAPWVQPWNFRLTCTNGQEIPDEGLKVDIRGGTVAEVLAEFEVICDKAFRQAERAIDALYDLRTRKLDYPERTLVRLAHEQNVPPRIWTALVERLPAFVDDDGTCSEFELVSLITHAANETQRDGTRRILERWGGNVVTEHVSRCVTCQAKLN